jgi:hypothetical protein
MTGSLHASIAEGCVQNGFEPDDPAPSNFGGEGESEKFEKPPLCWEDGLGSVAAKLLLL